MIAKSMEEMKDIAKEDKIMEAAIRYVDEFLESEGTTFEDKVEYEKAKAFDRGEKKGILNTAKNLLNMNYSTEMIRKATGLSEEELKILNQTNKNI